MNGNNMKRVLIFFLVFALLLPALAQAENIVFDFPSSMGKGNRPIPLEFQQAWFAEDAHAYQHGLCRLSLAMAMAAFRGDHQNPDAPIRRFFRDLQFSEPEVEEYAIKTQDTIGTAIAHRMIGAGEEAFPLVAIAVCGGNYGDEWVSNFDLGEEALHRGFAQSAGKAVERAKAYVAENGLQNPRFWISGYSRGAAVSNLTSAFLSQEGLAPDEWIFAYTFATPRTVRGEQAGSHSQIFNLVNVADLVPQVPPQAWGYDWFGRTLYLPTSLAQDPDYESLLPGYAAAMERLTGEKDAGEGDAAYAPKARAAVRGLLLSAQTEQKYASSFQQLLGKMFTGRELTAAEGILAMTMMSNMINATLMETEEKKTIRFSDGRNAMREALADSQLTAIFSQHMPEIYFSWLLALPDGEVIFRHTESLTNQPGF